MIFVQYYNKSIEGKFIEACGDRAVVVLDGRNRVETWHEDAQKFNGYRRPIYAGYRLFKGSSFLDNQPLTDIIRL
jgi:hypothetical protein